MPLSHQGQPGPEHPGCVSVGISGTWLQERTWAGSAWQSSTKHQSSLTLRHYDDHVGAGMLPALSPVSHRPFSINAFQLCNPVDSLFPIPSVTVLHGAIFRFTFFRFIQQCFELARNHVCPFCDITSNLQHQANQWLPLCRQKLEGHQFTRQQLGVLSVLDPFQTKPEVV